MQKVKKKFCSVSDFFKVQHSLLQRFKKIELRKTKVVVISKAV